MVDSVCIKKCHGPCGGHKDKAETSTSQEPPKKHSHGNHKVKENENKLIPAKTGFQLRSSVSLSQINSLGYFKSDSLLSKKLPQGIDK